MFSEKHVQAAIDRLPSTSTKDLKALLQTAEGKGLPLLAEACERELASRPFDFSGEAAVAFTVMAEQVQDMDLTQAIRHAFGKIRPANPDEIRFLRWLAANPGGTYADAVKAYGGRDLALMVGHLVYERYGCFRKFLQPGEDQSSVLIAKDRSGESVRYTMRPEFFTVLKELQVL